MLLEADHLNKSFGKVQAVSGVSFALEPRETLALIGPSGCGKTTTLRLLNRLIEPNTGTVRLDGAEAHDVPAPEWRRRMGYVVQSAGLFPHMSVAANIGVTPRLLGWEAAEIEAQVNRLLSMVGLVPEMFAHRMPAALSGGQRQRVGLARALAANPPVLLMDEPFAALDPLTKDGLIEDIKALREKLGFAIVIVTHDFSEAIRFADKIAVMNAGKIVQMGAPTDLITNPVNDEVRDMLAVARRSADQIETAFTQAGEGA